MRRKTESDAQAHGYYLNPDPDSLAGLLKGLERNEKRYGYQSCPCRLASGAFEQDRDIICPCDYRDPDVSEFGYCYCGLFVSRDVFEGKKSISPIPERRPVEKQTEAFPPPHVRKERQEPMSLDKKTKYLWFCKQCGYTCFREDPPYVCPVCKAKKEMFSRIQIEVNATR